MHVKTSLTMHNATKSATKHVSINLEISMKNNYKCKTLSMKIINSKWHGNNAMRECVKFLRQGLYL